MTELNKHLDGFDEEVMEKFMQYSWPGNLREFKNVIRRCALLTESGYIAASSLPHEISDSLIDHTSYTSPTSHIPKNTLLLKDSASKAEYETIMHVLKEVNFNKTKAAIILNVDRKTLYNKIKNYEN